MHTYCEQVIESQNRTKREKGAKTLQGIHLCREKIAKRAISAQSRCDCSFRGKAGCCVYRLCRYLDRRSKEPLPHHPAVCSVYVCMYSTYMYM